MKRLALCVLMSASLVMNSVTAFAYDYSTVREENSNQVYDSAKFYIDSHLPKLVGMEDSNGLGTGLVNYVNLYSYTGNVALDFLRKSSGNPIDRVVFPSNPSSGAFIGSANSLTVARESLLDSSSSNYTPAINAYFYWDNEYAENKMDTYGKLIFNTGSSYKFVSVPVTNTESTDSIEIKNTTINTLDGSEAVNRVADSDIKSKELVGDTLFIPVGVPVSVYNKYLTEQSADSDITLYKVIVHRNSDKTKGVSVSVDNHGILSVGNNESLGWNNSIGVDVEYIYKFKDGSELFNKYGKLGSATKTVLVYKDYPTMYRENSKKLPFYGDWKKEEYFYTSDSYQKFFDSGEFDSSFTLSGNANKLNEFISWTGDGNTYSSNKAGLMPYKSGLLTDYLSLTDKKPKLFMDSRILSASIASLELEVEPYLDSDYTNTYPTSATYYGVVFTYNYSTGLGVDSSNSIIVKEKEFQGGKVFRNYVGSSVNDSGIVYGDGWTKPSDAIHRKNLDLLTSNFRASQKHEDYQNFTAFSIDYTNRIALFYGNVDGRKDSVAPIRFQSTYLKVEPVEIKDVIVTDVPRYDRTIELTPDSYSKVEDMLTRLNGGDWWKNVYTLSHKINEEFGEYTVHVTSKYPVSDYYSIKLIVSDGMKPKFDDSYSLNITDGVLDREINRSDLIYRVNYNFMDDKWKVSGTFAEDKNESDTVYTIGDNLPSYIVVPIVNNTGKVIKELQVKLNVSLHQSQYEDIVVEIPSSLDLFDEDINKEAVVSAFEQYFNSKYNNIMSRITNGDTVPLSVGYDRLSNYVSVKLDNGFKDSDTGNRVKNYRFVEEPVATVYVDARSLDDNFFVVKDAVRDKLAEYLSDNGKDIDDYNIESISRDYVYNGNRTVVDTLDGIVKRDENIIVAVLTDKDSGKRKTIRFIAKPIANFAYFIETTEPIDTVRELTEEEYKHIEDEYGVTYPRESAIYSYTVSEDGKSADVLIKNGVLYKNGTIKDGILRVTLKPYKDTSRVVIWRKNMCSCGGKLVTVYPLYRIVEFPKDEPGDEESEEEPKVSDSNMPKVSDSNIPKVSDSNIPKKHEPKRDKPSPKENVEPKVPNDKDYPRENEPKDPTVITYIPQGNGGTEELFKKDGSVNGISREQEEERIRQEMLDNELKAKNMKANTRGTVKTADTRHMILMFAMFMGSAVLFAITILAKKKYEDNIG